MYEDDEAGRRDEADEGVGNAGIAAVDLSNLSHAEFRRPGSLILAVIAVRGCEHEVKEGQVGFSTYSFSSRLPFAPGKGTGIALNRN